MPAIASKDAKQKRENFSDKLKTETRKKNDSLSDGKTKRMEKMLLLRKEQQEELIKTLIKYEENL